MRARLHRPAAVVGRFAAPEDRAAVGVLADDLEPDVERIYGAAGEKMSDLARADHDVEPHRRPGHEHRLRAIEWRGELADFADHDRCVRFGLFADGEARHRLGRIFGPADHWCPHGLLVDRRGAKDVDRHEP
jgi:hypothetical protein